MERSIRNRTLALAALFQALTQVRDLAWTGRCDPEALRTSISSLFRFSAPDIEGVYGGPGGLHSGIEALERQLDRKGDPRDMEMTRYAIGLLLLERKLSENPDAARQLREGLEGAQRQVEHFGDITHDSVLARIAPLYQDTISPLGPRIMVSGEAIHLGNADTAARIRALLLAAIRAAWLWRQAGGSRWRLILQRGAMLRECRALLHAA